MVLKAMKFYFVPQWICFKMINNKKCKHKTINKLMIDLLMMLLEIEETGKYLLDHYHQMLMKVNLNNISEAKVLKLLILEF
jgi:hypothetical protein